MQVWLEAGGSRQAGVDRVLGEDLLIREGEKSVVCIDGREVGRVVDISTADGQARARSMVGSVEWIVLEFGDWTMIPAENLVAACNGGPTRVAARIKKSEQVMGAAFALEIGVDALLVPETIVETALIAKASRAEEVEKAPLVEPSDLIQLREMEVLRVADGGVGHRVCVDLTCLLEEGEGMLTGSSSSSLILVHSETIKSEFVPSRPFRVNAGAVHAYILMADDTTKYLCELRMGDAVAVVDSRSSQRRVGIVGRCKVERRPFSLITWKDAHGQCEEAGTFLQQAETVRLLRPKAAGCISVTDLATGSRILGWSSPGARHIGARVSGEVREH